MQAQAESGGMVLEIILSVVCEPLDWYFALNDGFQWHDTIGLLPVVPAVVGRHGDDLLGILRYGDDLAVANRALRGRPFAESDVLNSNLIEQMYRGKWVDGRWVSYDQYPGGLAGAVRRQLKTGELVGGVDHSPKGWDRIRQMKEILRVGIIDGQVLSAHDIEIVRALHDDLLNALLGK